MRERVQGDDIEVEVDGLGTVRCSGERELVGDKWLWLPVWLEVERHGEGGEPDEFARIELRDGVPRLVQLSWTARPHQREIRQKDLRDTEVASITETLFPMFGIRADLENQIAHIPLLETGEYQKREYQNARQFIQGLRNSPGSQVITSELLERVADVYRNNFERGPTQAVAEAFGVPSRMASTYVQKARERKLLPPTKQGQKKA